jgi:hypothetical protein
MTYIGKKAWLIPDMYWPEITSEGHYVSHESVCVLNTSDQECKIDFILYYEDRAPISGLFAVCPPQRTLHVRMDRLTGEDGMHIPRGVPYAAVVNASIPVVVQYTRVDTTQSANSIMTTMAFSLT